MEDNRTELQRKFEEQSPTIKSVGQIEYLRAFVSWLHLRVERLEREKLPINIINKSVYCEDCRHTINTRSLRNPCRCVECGGKL